MNYTNPNDLSYEDKPEDWLNSALIFARAIGLLFDENQGIVVDIKGDAKYTLDESARKVIVFASEGQIKIIKCEENLSEGTFVRLGEYNPN